MTSAETKKIYEGVCRAKRLVPQEDEGRIWHRTLSGFDLQDVEAALDLWWADTTLDSNGNPRGKWLPTPAELKPTVERLAARRAAANREPHDVIRWKCEKQHTCSGLYARSEPTPIGKRCSCGAALQMIERVPA